jgi:hypothetical protein
MEKGRHYFNFDKFKENRKNGLHNKTYRIFNNDELFIENSITVRSVIRNRIIIDNLIPYVCNECDNHGTHNGKPLSLQLEHKNGINNDNRLENLCFLCPNCHTQTSTYAGRNAKNEKIIKLCEHCHGQFIPNNSKTKYCCRACACIEREKYRRMDRTKKFNVDKNQLEYLINTYPMTTVGKMFDVSDNAIRKRCLVLGIELKKKKPRI